MAAVVDGLAIGPRSGAMKPRILGHVLHPNPPRLVTVVVALALLVVGLSATVLPIDFVNELLAAVQGSMGANIAVTPEVGWLCMLVGDALLVAGSLLPGV